jgi:hypothetical protein
MIMITKKSIEGQVITAKDLACITGIIIDKAGRKYTKSLSINLNFPRESFTCIAAFFKGLPVYQYLTAAWAYNMTRIPIPEDINMTRAA